MTVHVPDPRLHRIISFWKSALRLAGYMLLVRSLALAAVVLALSEVLGIAEEAV